MTWRPDPPLWVDWLEALATAALIATVALALLWWVLFGW